MVYLCGHGKIGKETRKSSLGLDRIALAGAKTIFKPRGPVTPSVAPGRAAVHAESKEREMTKSTFGLAARFLAVVLVAHGAAGQWLSDYVPNGSFELDVNRDGAPDGWQPALFQSPATATWDRSVAHSGVCSVRVEDSKHATGTEWSDNTGRWVQAARRDAVGGREYTVQAWLRTRLTSGEARLTLAWFGGRKWLHEDSAESVKGRSDWTPRRLTVAAPAEADSVAVYLMLNAGVGEVWFDDVSMTAGDSFPSELEPVDIRAACTTGFRDETAGDGRGGWTDQGANDVRDLPPGRQTWRSVPFDIVDPVRNGGNSCVMLAGGHRRRLPPSASFAVGRRCDTVYFLHGCAWAGRDGGPVATYRVEYAGGDHVDIPLRNGREIVDWWDPRDTKQSVAGWRGRNAESARIGFSIFPWTNPRPDESIRSISVVSRPDGPVPFLIAVTTGKGPAVFAEAPLELEFTDTDGWYEWAFALDNPGLAEIDLSHLLDAPAGKHGFVTVRGDGHFAYEDGSRARFFGTNIGGRRCSPDRREAEMIAERLARSGVNMLRLHAPDSRWSDLIDTSDGTSRRLNPEVLDRYDYFVAELKKRGIYVYFDLLDYRRFLPGDGVRDADKMDVRWEHSIKGASIFDRRMIELQKEFATQLLTHRNPYTGLRYVDEPALAVQEITNENSLFYLANTKLMLPSYVDDLRGLWNQWLLKRHRDRSGLAEAWTNGEGQCALLAQEDPAAGTVVLPLEHLYSDVQGVEWQAERGPARLNAMTRFLYELETEYYREMTAHLRGIGLRCPITGTNQDFSDASNRANAACDFTSRNNYWCHPNLNAKPFFRYSNASALRSDICRTANPVSNVASSTSVGKPMIAPEFNSPWPNEWRAECLPLMACYGRLQDWDGLLYFAYSPEEERLSCFGNQSDPVRWGQVPLAALLFLRGDVSVARQTVHVGVSAVDTFATRPRRTADRYSPYNVLSYISKVRNAYFDDAYSGEADIVVSSGHSSWGDYSQARRAIVFSDWPYADEAGRDRDRGRSARQTCPSIKTQKGAGRHDTEMVVESLSPGAELISRSERPVGFVTDRRYVFPCASADGAEDGAWLHRLVLDALGRWDLPGKAPLGEAGQVFRSDTGELVLDSQAGVFTAVAPRVRVALGSLGAAGAVELGSARLRCSTAFASVSLISLDGQPVEESRRLLLTSVARSENTGQATLDDHTRLAETGRTPVLGEPVDAEVRVRTTVALRAYSLSPVGARQAELPCKREGGALSLTTKDARSPWVLLVGE